MEVLRLGSDYSPGRSEAALATPTCCCCCCCCCCTLVVPEVMVGTLWANQAIAAYSQARFVPPLGEVMKAYAGGVVAGNLMFLPLAVVIGFYLVLATLGAYFIAIGAALLVALAIAGARVGAKIPQRPGTASNVLVGSAVGAGMMVLVTAMSVGIGFLVLIPFGARVGFDMVPYLGAALASVAAGIVLLVRGSKSRRPMLPIAAAPPWPPGPPPPQDPGGPDPSSRRPPGAR